MKQPCVKVVGLPALSAALLAIALASACVGPQVDDVVIGSGDILPEEIPLPDAEDDPDIRAQIEEADGVDGLIPRIHAFANGQSVWYWDLGYEPNSLAPIFILVRRTSGGDLEPIDHRIVVGTIPGDPGYSSFWVVVHVVVTDLYDGEQLTSVTAIEEAEELGLVETPIVEDIAINCPTVARNSLLELGGGEPDLPPDKQFYWERQIVYFYDFGVMPTESSSVPSTNEILRISRVGQPPLSEFARGVDINGDGDTNDTNDIFSLRFDQPGASPACRVRDVTVAADQDDPILIDDPMMRAPISNFSDLFNPGPVGGRVVAFEDTDELRNCVQQTVTGGI